jgi:hypothetical protein
MWIYDRQKLAGAHDQMVATKRPFIVGEVEVHGRSVLALPSGSVKDLFLRLVNMVALDSALALPDKTSPLI